MREAHQTKVRQIAAIAMLLGCVSCDEVTPTEAKKASTFHASAQTSNETGPVTFFDDKPLDLTSPNRVYRLLSKRGQNGLVNLTAVWTDAGREQRQLIGTFEPPTSVLWSPVSDAFVLNDQRGSGQTSYLEIVRLDHGRFRRDITARHNLAGLFRRLFECQLPDDAITTYGESWLDARTVVTEVQATVHSGGCPLDPFATNKLSLLVDARTGQVKHRIPQQP